MEVQVQVEVEVFVFAVVAKAARKSHNKPPRSEDSRWRRWRWSWGNFTSGCWQVKALGKTGWQLFTLFRQPFALASASALGIRRAAFAILPDKHWKIETETAWAAWENGALNCPPVAREFRPRECGPSRSIIRPPAANSQPSDNQHPTSQACVPDRFRVGPAGLRF